MKKNLCTSMLCFVAVMQLHASSYAESFNTNKFDSAMVYFQNRNLHQAEKCLRILQATNPQDPRVLFYLGRINFKKGNFERASKCFLQASKKDKKSAEIHLWIGRSSGQLARTAMAGKNAIYAYRARREIETAIALKPDYAEAHLALLQYYLVAPRMLGGSIDRAVAEARIVNSLSPGLGLIADGMLFEFKQEYARAEKSYSQALTDSKYRHFAWLALERMYRKQGRLSSAIVLFEQILQEHPHNIDVLFRVGYLYQEVQNYDAAFSVFDLILSLHDNMGSALLEMARTAVFSGQKMARAKSSIASYLKAEGLSEVEIARARLIQNELIDLSRKER